MVWFSDAQDQGRMVSSNIELVWYSDPPVQMITVPWYMGRALDE
jgi:hypothetical protein